MQLTVTFDPSTETDELERLLAALGDHDTEPDDTTAPAETDDTAVVNGVISRTKPTQRDWMDERVHMCRNLGLDVRAPQSRHLYLRAYDRDSTRPEATIVMLHPERTTFILPATIADEYDDEDVYRVANDERVIHRGRDLDVFRSLVQRTIDYLRA